MRTEQMPVMRIELDHMKQSIVHALNAREGEIADAIERILSEIDLAAMVEGVVRRDAQAIIEATVRDSIKRAIGSILGNWEVHALLESSIKASVLEKLTKAATEVEPK